MGKVILKDINHSFGKTEVLHNINLEIQDGELFTLLGPSGCGKTTLLRIIAGFIKPTTGSVLLNKDNITSLPPEKRNIGTVFQNYALFPNMNVEDNILYGLKIRKLNKTELDHRLKHYSISIKNYCWEQYKSYSKTKYTSSYTCKSCI